MALKPRRCIFFAGWSQDGTVDDADRNYLLELARFGDVFALYDNDSIGGANADEVASGVEVVLAEKHGEYDFGSWKRLYNRLRSEELEEYDELFLVNNSVVIVEHMDALFERRSAAPEQFFSIGLLDEEFPGPEVFIRDFLRHVDRFHSSVMYPSIFWSLRRDLVKSYYFRHFIGSVERQASRLEVCYKYERGFSRSLWRHDASIATMLDKIYPMSFLYRDDAFQLIKMGIPFIKRKALNQEFYPIEFLDQRIRALVAQCNPDFREGLLGAIAAVNGGLK